MQLSNSASQWRRMSANHTQLMDIIKKLGKEMQYVENKLVLIDRKVGMPKKFKVPIIKIYGGKK